MVKIHSLIHSSLWFFNYQSPYTIFYGHDIRFDNRKMDTLIQKHVQIFLKVGDFINDHPNDNAPNGKIKDMYLSCKYNCNPNKTIIKFFKY